MHILLRKVAQRLPLARQVLRKRDELLQERGRLCAAVNQLRAEVAQLDRVRLASVYLRGNGIEIGALHAPLAVPMVAQVSYVDRMSTTDLRAQYPELADMELVEPAIIDNGETLTTISANSQDFLIANHFLEHCQDPIQTLINFFRVLKSGGVAYLAVPDKRYTFDRDRPVTPLTHLIEDHEKGPARSRRQHFEEWARYVDKLDGEAVDKQVKRLMDLDYSIHYHAWTQTEFLELLLACKSRLQFDFEAVLKRDNEVIAILRKLDVTAGLVNESARNAA